MQQHARAVEHAGEVARGVARQALRCCIHDGFAGRLAAKQRRTSLVEYGNHVGLHRVGAENGNEPRDARFVENPVDGRRPAALRR